MGQDRISEIKFLAERAHDQMKPGSLQQNCEDSTPVFSVIMNCYNSEEFLQDALDSVFAQDFDDFEIIFFDNASSDSSAKIARKYGSRIHYIRNPVLVPLGAARNLAITYARGEFIAFLDCDDVWASSKLRLQYQALMSEGGGRPYGFCYTDAMRMRASGEDILSYSSERNMVQGEVIAELMMDCFIAMSSCVIRRDVIVELGGFDEGFNLVEEWDLWIRAARYYDLAFVPSCETRIRFHGSNTSRNYQAQRKEVKQMLNSIVFDDKLLESVRRYALDWFKVRFTIIDAIHSLNANKGKKIEGLYLIFGCLLKHPMISIRMVRSYFNRNMLHFFYTKYFQRDI